MNVGYLVFVSMVAPVLIHPAPSAVSVKLVIQDSTVRVSLHLVLLLSVSTGALAVRQEISAMSVLAYPVSELPEMVAYPLLYESVVDREIQHKKNKSDAIGLCGTRASHGTQA